MVKIRLLLLLLLLCSICQAQTVLKTHVTMPRQIGTVGEFLADLNKISGVVMSYSSEVVDLSKTISLNGNEKTIEDVLKAILKGQALKLVEQSGKIFLVPESPVKKKSTLSGYIIDVESGERLIGASIYIPSKKAGTTSNTYGFFSITLEQDNVDVQITYAGYFSKLTPLDLRQDTSMTITLERNTVLNELVVVNAEGKKNTQNRTLVGKTDVPAGMVKSISVLMGEADVLKTLQLLPGIQAGNEGTAGLNVRGGSADQNLILLDGVPVYNASHAFGLFSVFNADAVNNVEVLKSGFPASYGGRLSSVIDVHMKEGDKYNIHGEGGIGLVFSKFTLEGPLKKGRSSFLLSGRRTYADLFLRPILKLSGSGVDVTPFFGDMNAKANFPVGNKDRLYFSLYMGQDKFRVKEEGGGTTYDDGFSWGNTTALTRWNHVFNKRTFSNFTFTYSSYKFRTKQFSEEKGTIGPAPFSTTLQYFSGIRDWNIKADIDYLPAPHHFVKAGFAATLHRYEPGISRLFQKDTAVMVNSELGNRAIYSKEYDVYVEDDIRISTRMKTNVGLRFSGFSIKGKMFSSLQPRFNWLFKLTDKWSMKASYSSMNQFIHLLTNSGLGLPTDLWVPVTDRVPPQTSQHFSAGTSYSHDKSMEVSMELYYKKLNNVIEYSEGAGFGNVYGNWEDIIEVGKGKTYGMEWLLQKRKGRLTGLVSYTLSHSLRKFENINGGREFPFKYDRRHEVKMGIVWKPSANLECSSNWFFSTGNAISLPVAYYHNPYTGEFIDIYESRNNYRMPDYHRLDVSLKFIKQKKRYVRTWVLSVYNVYNRHNPFFRYKTYDYLNNTIVFRDVTIFPFLPSLSYQFKF